MDHLIAFYTTKTRIQFQRGQETAASETIEQGRASGLSRGFDRLVKSMDLEEIRQSLARAELAPSQRFLARYNFDDFLVASEKSDQMTSRDEVVMLALGRAVPRLGKAREAISALRTWRVFLRDRGVLKSDVRVLIEIAICHMYLGQEGEAQRNLREAVHSAQKGRYIRVFLDAGPAIKTLLFKIFGGKSETSGETTKFGRVLINQFDESQVTAQELSAPLPGKCTPDIPHLPPENLSQTEVDVLRLVAFGMTNKQIGRRLGLTEGTIKWYMQQVFDKLGVRRRTLAIRIAQNYGLI